MKQQCTGSSMTSTGNKGLNKSRTLQGLTQATGELFPKSPQLISGDGAMHWGHPKHPLLQLNTADMFTCAGCKERGAGDRFSCPHCDYQLHLFCANAPATLDVHPLHCMHMLTRFAKPAKGSSKCDICHKACKGYSFRCKVCSFQMHPCCATLAPEIRLTRLHPHTLRLLPPEAPLSSSCTECNRKRSGRVYHCSVCDYHVHAVCAKNAVNGLRDHGYKDQKTNNVLDNAARLASQVMIDFLEGLIGGIADGVGQVIAQDALKGRPPSTSSAAAKRRTRNDNNKNSE